MLQEGGASQEASLGQVSRSSAPHLLVFRLLLKVWQSQFQVPK